MARAPLTFEQSVLIGLECTPRRMLREHASEEQITTELLHVASQFPKRTKRQLQLYGPGEPTIRLDLIAIAVGRQLRDHRLFLRRHGGPDYYLHHESAQLLRQAGETVGQLDEDLVQTHEWPTPPSPPLNMSPQQAKDWHLQWEREWHPDSPPL